MRVISTRVDDFIAEQVEKLGKPADVLRRAILLYTSNKLGICEDLALTQQKIMMFRDIFAEAVEVYRRFRGAYSELYSMLTVRPFDPERFAELLQTIDMHGDELSKYLEVITEFLGIMRTEKEPYREFDSVLDMRIQALNDVLDEYRRAKAVGVTMRIPQLDIFSNLPLEVRKKIVDETLRKSIKLRFDMFSSIDTGTALEFIQYIERLNESPLRIIGQICNGERNEFNLPMKVCSVYDSIIIKKLPDYLTEITDIVVRYGVDRKEATRVLMSIILANDNVYNDLELSKVALGLVAFNRLNDRMASIFDLSASRPEALYLTSLLVELERARKKVCVQ